jgi:hypothetical protein
MDKAKQEKQSIALNIRKYGWHCLHVFGDASGRSQFTYSIGFTESYGAPEMMVFGLPKEKGHGVLSACAAMLKQGHRFETDMPDGNVLSGGYEVICKSVRSRHFPEYLGTAMRYYEPLPFQAIVVFLPDKNHRFPWKMTYAGADATEALNIVSM